MKIYNTTIIGGGASGLIAGIHLNDKNSILLEKNDILGKKILITGGGRCNLTNNKSLKEYVKSYYNSGNYYRNAFNHFFNKDIISLLEKNGCKCKVEDNDRVFPKSDNSKSVQNTLVSLLKSSNTKYQLNSNVNNINKKDDLFTIKYNNSMIIKSRNIILATGGNCYPKTGSNGDGYLFAKKLGHNISKQMGGLAPIEIEEKWIKRLEGLTVTVNIEIKANKKSIVKDEGSILFTENGITGPMILNNSMEIEKHLRKEKNVKIYLDFCHNLSFEELDNILQNDFSNNSKKSIKNYLHKFLPKRLCNEFLLNLNIDSKKILNQINKKERINIRDSLKRSILTV